MIKAFVEKIDLGVIFPGGIGVISGLLQDLPQRRVVVGSLRCAEVGTPHQQADPAGSALCVVKEAPESHAILRQ